MSNHLAYEEGLRLLIRIVEEGINLARDPPNSQYRQMISLLDLIIFGAFGSEMLLSLNLL